MVCSYGWEGLELIGIVVGYDPEAKLAQIRLTGKLKTKNEIKISGTNESNTLFRQIVQELKKNGQTINEADDDLIEIKLEKEAKEGDLVLKITQKQPKLDEKMKHEIIKEQLKEKILDPKRSLLPKLELQDLPTYVYDCHGKTFGNKEVWINNDQVAKILRDDDYSILEDGETPQIGDIVIYVKDGAITHSGFVHDVGSGVVTKIQSKWGMTADWVHHPSDVPQNYGEWIVYRKRKENQ